MRYLVTVLIIELAAAALIFLFPGVPAPLPGDRFTAFAIVAHMASAIACLPIAVADLIRALRA